MTTTAQDIVTAAFGRDAKLRGEWFTTLATELLGVVNRLLQGAFLEGADINPGFFGQRTLVTPSASSWSRQPDAVMVYRVRTETGGYPVAVVAEEDANDLGLNRRAIYEWGQAFYPCPGGTLTGSERLYFYQVNQPRILTSLSSVIDERWPDRYNDLLIIPTAQYLVAKDGRPEAGALWQPELDSWKTLFRADLSQATVNVEGAHPIASTPSAKRVAVRGGDRA